MISPVLIINIFLQPEFIWPDQYCQAFQQLNKDFINKKKNNVHHFIMNLDWNLFITIRMSVQNFRPARGYVSGHNRAGCQKFSFEARPESSDEG